MDRYDRTLTSPPDGYAFRDVPHRFDPDSIDTHVEGTIYHALDGTVHALTVTCWCFDGWEPSEQDIIYRPLP